MTEPIENPQSGEFVQEDQAFQFTQSLLREQVREVIQSGLFADTFDTAWKSDNTPVTTVDINVNQLIIDSVNSQFPNDRILGEELSLDGGSGFTWVVDPIDGTQALGIVPTSTTCVARTDKKGQPLFGVVYNPLTDELFAAQRGETATLNGSPLQVSSKTEIKGSYIFLGSRMQEPFASNGVIYDRFEGEGGKVLNTRSLAFGCVMVAKGVAEGAFIGVKTPYEAAAIKLIVEGAGGKVTDLYGNEPGRLDGEIRGLVVSNGHIHDALLAALVKLHPET